jgi:hypothetical protein
MARSGEHELHDSAGQDPSPPRRCGASTLRPIHAQNRGVRQPCIISAFDHLLS